MNYVFTSTVMELGLFFYQDEIRAAKTEVQQDIQLTVHQIYELLVSALIQTDKCTTLKPGTMQIYSCISKMMSCRKVEGKNYVYTLIVLYFIICKVHCILK